MIKISSRKTLYGVLFLIGLKWTVVGAVAYAGMSFVRGGEEQPAEEGSNVGVVTFDEGPNVINATQSQ